MENQKNHQILLTVIESGDFKLQGDALTTVGEALSWFRGLSSKMALLDEIDLKTKESQREVAEEQKQLPPPQKKLPPPSKVESIDNSDSKHKKINGGHKTTKKKKGGK